MRYIFLILILISLQVEVSRCQTLDSISPLFVDGTSFSNIVITITGQNFVINRDQYININGGIVGVTIESATKITFKLPATTSDVTLFTISYPSSGSQIKLPVVYFDQNSFLQENQYAYLSGKGFDAITNILFSFTSLDGTVKSMGGVKNDSSTIFLLMSGYGSSLNIIDFQNNVVIFTFIAQITPVFQSSLITNSIWRAQIYYLPTGGGPIDIRFNNYKTLFINLTNIASTPTAYVTIPNEAFYTPVPMITAFNSAGATITKYTYATTLLTYSFANSTVNVTGSALAMTVGTLVLSGLDSPLEAAVQEKRTLFSFPYPENISCSSIFVKDQYRRSNNLLICPTPSILGIQPPPSPTENSVVTITGRNIIDSLVDTLENYILYPDGTKKPCLSNQFDSTTNTSIVKCNVAPGSGTFKFHSGYQVSNQFTEISYRYNPYIESVTPTKFGTPGTVTIVGRDFDSSNLVVKIGGYLCTSPLVLDSKTITCLFQSNISSSSQPLEVSISIDTIFNSKSDVFLYTKPEQQCPIGSNGQVCSAHGNCNQQLQCDCNNDWESNDCSLPNLGVGLTPPVVNENNTTSTITTPSGTKYDIGIAMINELDSNSNIIQSYNINNIQWLNVTQDNVTFLYKTILDNKSTLQVTLTINDKDERLYYNFAGDIIPILPKSIKYQIELYNWTFGSTQNNVEFVFKSAITESTNNECSKKETTTTQSNSDNTIRNIQMSMNGETLIGTFSDRMILDTRPTYNKVNKLTTDQINKYQLDTTTAVVYTSIQTSYFKNSIIVDPNFGVLVSSTPDECSISKGMPNWKLAVIIVCSVVGAAILVTAVWMLFKKNQRVKIIALKLKARNK
ncbi:hypothetical protein CYY_006189 [Polysphondylium violaceum]|uniref:ComC supersandwich domain-containing protein n=1 Tax=Polysphondylium violaceum TaxID=133409 RepID=A0A8J4PSB4_9MYCE|nr:hypothetical protein CYY_006189 [Polysphondylium violaceum]